MTTKTDTRGPSHDQQSLYEYFEFDEADLAANRLGVFSKKQKLALKNEKRDFKKSSVIVGVVFISVGLVILFLLFGLHTLKGSRMDWIDVGNSLPAILIPLVFLGIGIGSLAGGIKKNVRRAEHSVQRVEGPVKIVEVERLTYRYPNRRVPIYELRVGNKEFDAYTDLPRVMTQDDVYAVYFDRADDTILSVERISKG
jgi:hypothetical protein